MAAVPASLAIVTCAIRMLTVEALQTNQLKDLRPEEHTKVNETPTIARFPEQLVPYVMDRQFVHMSKDYQQLMDEIEALDDSNKAGSPDEAHLLGWMIKTMGFKKVIEVGIFRGSTTLAIAEALPDDGKVYALDINTDYTSTAAKYWASAGVKEKIELLIAPATNTMERLLKKYYGSQGEGSFDLVFVDADKENYENYYELGLKLLRKGGVVVIDNTLYHGRVIDGVQLDYEAAGGEGSAKEIQDLNAKLDTDPRVEVSFLSIADGVTLATKK